MTVSTKRIQQQVDDIAKALATKSYLPHVVAELEARKIRMENLVTARIAAGVK